MGGNISEPIDLEDQSINNLIKSEDQLKKVIKKEEMSNDSDNQPLIQDSNERKLPPQGLKKEKLTGKRPRVQVKFDDYAFDSDSENSGDEQIKPAQKRVKTESAEIKQKSRKQPKKVKKKNKRKMTEKEKMMAKYLEAEAEEGSSEEADSNSEDEEGMKKLKERETYTAEELKRRTVQIDNDFCNRLAEKYQDQSEDDEIEDELEVARENRLFNRDAMFSLNGKLIDPDEMQQIREDNELLERERMERHQMLPSIMDSKIWRVKCAFGQEKVLVSQLLKKAIDSFNNGKPNMLVTTFNCEKSPGCIYMESFNKSHVTSFIEGISGLYIKQIEHIPYEEMSELISLCQVPTPLPVQEHQWVRIKSGLYQDDLGIVEHIQGRQKAIVKLIPRIQETLGADGQQKYNFTKKFKNPDSEQVRVPQKRFNPLHVQTEEVNKIKDPSMRKNFYMWKDHLFRNGFLYLPVKFNKLIYDKVNPSLVEVMGFQCCNPADDMLSDEDEWDLLTEQTLLKTIKNDQKGNLEIGDKVQVTSGASQYVKGQIVELKMNGDVSIKTFERIPVVHCVKRSLVKKYFETGDSVRVIEGSHAGESGIINSIINEKHAIVTMSSTKSEIKILLTNLKIKKEEMGDVLVNAYAKKSQSENRLNAGEMILYDNQLLGFIIHVYPDYLKVLTPKNLLVNVKTACVNKKITYRKPPNGLDKNNSVISQRTVVKIEDQSFLQGKTGEIRGMYKDNLFVFIKGQQKNSNGIYAVRAKQCTNVGVDLVQKVQQENHQGFILGNMDRKERMRNLKGKFVYVSMGPLKGLKGRIVQATDTNLYVEIFSRKIKVMLNRNQVDIIHDPTQETMIGQGGILQQSFDEAARREIGQEDSLMMKEGGRTPKHGFDDEDYGTLAVRDTSVAMVQDEGWN